MSEAIAFDELAVGSPLPLELLQRRGIHHGAGGLKLMDVHVDQARLPPPVRQKDLSLCLVFNFAQRISQSERVSPNKGLAASPPVTRHKPLRMGGGSRLDERHDVAGRGLGSFE